MKFVLIPLATLVIVGVFLLRRLVGDKVRRAGSGGVRLVIIVKDQELWVEGFIRKLFRCVNRTPWLEVVVVDDSSRDGTRAILNRLQRKYSFSVLFVNEGDDTGRIIGATETGGNFSDTRCFDARGLKGKDFLNVPLFCHLTQCNAGISRVLSK